MTFRVRGIIFDEFKNEGFYEKRAMASLIVDTILTFT
jgi:hypothetical protein